MKDMLDYSSFVGVVSVVSVRKLATYSVAEGTVIELIKGSKRRNISFMCSPTWKCDVSNAKAGERILVFLSHVSKSDLQAHNPEIKGIPAEGIDLIGHSGSGRIVLHRTKSNGWDMPVTRQPEFLDSGRVLWPLTLTKTSAVPRQIVESYLLKTQLKIKL